MLNKPVRIRTVTKIDTNVTQNDNMLDEVSRYTLDVGTSDGADDSADLTSVNGSGLCENGNPVMLEVKGVMLSDTEGITVEYTSYLSGPLPNKVTYRFDYDKRNVLTVTRGCVSDRVYFFENQCKRQTVIYDSDEVSFELGIYTKSLKNCITYENGGYIEIEYFAELRGGVLEHCREYVLVEPIK